MLNNLWMVSSWFQLRTKLVIVSIRVQGKWNLCENLLPCLSIRTVVRHVSFYLELPHYRTHFHHKYSLLGVSELYCTRTATELSAANGLVLLECVQSLVSCLVSKFCIIKGNQTVLPNSPVSDGCWPGIQSHHVT